MLTRAAWGPAPSLILSFGIFLEQGQQSDPKGTEQTRLQYQAQVLTAREEKPEPDSACRDSVTVYGNSRLGLAITRLASPALELRRQRQE